MSFGLKETWHRPGGSWPQYLTKATLGTPAAVVSCAVRMENGTEVEQLVGQPQALCPLLAGPLPMASASDMHRPLLPFFFSPTPSPATKFSSYRTPAEGQTHFTGTSICVPMQLNLCGAVGLRMHITAFNFPERDTTAALS